jgi:hypothetical protein
MSPAFLTWDDEDARPLLPHKIEAARASHAAEQFGQQRLDDETSMFVAVECPDRTLFVFRVDREVRFTSCSDQKRTALLREEASK